MRRRTSAALADCGAANQAAALVLFSAALVLFGAQRRRDQPPRELAFGANENGGAVMISVALRAQARNALGSPAAPAVEAALGAAYDVELSNALSRTHALELDRCGDSTSSRLSAAWQVPRSRGAWRTSARALSRYSITLIAVPTRSSATKAVRLFVDMTRGKGSKQDRSTLFIHASPAQDTPIMCRAAIPGQE